MACEQAPPTVGHTAWLAAKEHFSCAAAGAAPSASSAASDASAAAEGARQDCARMAKISPRDVEGISISLYR